MKIKKTKFYEVNMLRGTIGKEYDRAGEIRHTEHTKAVSGRDLLECSAFQNFVEEYLEE